MQDDSLTNRKSSEDRTGQTDRDKLFCTLCDRYNKSHEYLERTSVVKVGRSSLVGNQDQRSEYLNSNLNYRKESVFAKSVAIQRHATYNMEAMKKDSIKEMY